MYKVIFLNRGKVYELYAKGVGASGIYGFVEVEELIFDPEDTLVVDPTEERMRAEFADVRRLHLPMHAVIRVEEVEKRGTAKIRDQESGETVMSFPLSPPSKTRN